MVNMAAEQIEVRNGVAICQQLGGRQGANPWQSYWIWIVSCLAMC